MTTLAAAVVVIAAISVVNLLLTFGIIRRVRDHDAKLTAAGQYIPIDTGLPVGQAVPPFEAVTTEGERVDQSGLSRGSQVVAFFSSSCEACREHLPQVTRYLSTVDRAQTLVVVSGDERQGADLVETLAPLARTVVEDEMGPLVVAFRVQAFPAFFALQDGVVTVNAPTVRSLLNTPVA
jgi:thiol-disulfide isomerase/thioredoxin